MGADEAIDAADGRRLLGFWMCLALVVGNVIGSGIFLLPASLAPYGVNAIIGWLVTIGGSLCLAYVYAALARALPTAGGPYGFAREAFGEPPAFFVMWSYWISIWVTNAAISIAAVSYLSSLAPGLFDTPAVSAALAAGFVTLFAGVAVRGVRSAGAVQLVTSILKLLPLLAVVLIGAFVFARGDAPAIQAAAPITLPSVAATAALTLWAMLGFESAAVPSGKVRDPGRIVPRATLAGTLIAGTIYLLVSGTVFLLLPAQVAAGSNAPLADLVRAYWGYGPASLVALFAAISALGAVNGWVLLQGEVPLTLARAGVFPRWFARTNAVGISVRAHVLGTALTAALIAMNYTRGMAALFTFMALLATVATLILYLACSVAALVMLRRGLLRGAHLGALAAIGTLYSLWTLYGAGLESTAWGGALLLTGVPVYWLMRTSRRAAGDRAALPE